MIHEQLAHTKAPSLCGDDVERGGLGGTTPLKFGGVILGEDGHIAKAGDLHSSCRLKFDLLHGS